MAKEKSRVSPFIYAVLEQAGGGPLVATLTGNVTYELVGPRVLVLDGGGAFRTITLPTAEANHNGDKWVVRNAGTDGFAIAIVDGAGTGIITLGNGSEAVVYNARGTYVVSKTQATVGSDTDPTFRKVGGRVNGFTADDDTITATDSAAAYVDFANPVVLAGGTIGAGVRVSILASIFLSDAAAGTATLKTKLTIGPREVWTYVISTATGAETYGVDLVLPEAVDITITSAASTSKPLIAGQIATAWNADATASSYATAVSDGVDTVTFTSITDRFLKLAEDENFAKTVLTQTVSATTLVETTAVDQAADDFQALDFEINSLAAAGATSELSGVGSWMTNTGGTLANSVEMLLPADFDTSEDLIIRAWALFSAADATTTARCAFLSVRSE